ncbi:hypothetical protein BD626DRAFT_484985 [Schizophyllum amplum]|uniref:Tetraspanin family-domain-containing protein n=1 Tax=Schizophyllum amplum TaxID=97359 RepID=A0A550CQV5_9AGAR|nr:hypothetical protein BD626DRAFT_484985 [Auriculariopsis ampla]
MATRPPPPQGAPPPYSIVGRVYQRNLRPVVLTTTFLSALYALFLTIGAFRSVGSEKSRDNLHDLVNFTIAIGALSAVALAIELFGFAGAAMQRVGLVRIYALLSVFTTLLVVAGGIVQLVMHFHFKDAIIDECSSLAEGQEVYTYPFGFWGPVHESDLSKEDADRWCRQRWDHDSWSEVIELLITAFIAALFSMIAFGYYRQLLDPASAANASRAPSNEFRGGVAQHYAPPYNANVPAFGGYGQQPYMAPYNAYAPPAGPPPGFKGDGGYKSDGGYNGEHDDPFKPPYDSELPKYSGEGRSSADDKDPFADYDVKGTEERDVTSRPAPGGRDRF